MINLFVEITATLTDVIFLVWFVSRFHDIPISKNFGSLVWAVLLFSYQIFIDTVLPAFNMVALIGALLFSVCFSLSLERKAYIRSIFAAFLYLIVIMLTGNVIYSIFSLVIEDIGAVIHGSRSYLRVIYLLICKFVHLAFYQLILKVLGKDKTLNWKNGVLSFVFTIATASALGFLMKLAIENPNHQIEVIVLFLAVLLVLLNLILYVMINQAQVLLKNKYELVLMQDRMKYEKNRVEEAAIIWSNIRQVKHDLKNHFAVLSGHLNEGDIEFCQKYVAKLNTTIETMGNMIQSGNSVIDYLINSKLSNLDGVEVLVSGYVGNYGDIDDVDLVCILGNILDNAIEAQEDIETEKRIELHFLHRKTSRIIICKNTIKASVLSNNRKMESTKKNPELHGIGHQIVEATVMKYNGLIDYFENDGVFGLQIMLPDAIPPSE